MTAHSRARFHLGVALCAFVAAACSGSLALYLLANGVFERGSPAGDILTVGIGLAMLLATAIVFIFGTFNWNSARSDSPQDESDSSGESSQAPYPSDGSQ